MAQVKVFLMHEDPTTVSRLFLVQKFRILPQQLLHNVAGLLLDKKQNEVCFWLCVRLIEALIDFPNDELWIKNMQEFANEFREMFGSVATWMQQAALSAGVSYLRQPANALLEAKKVIAKLSGAYDFRAKVSDKIRYGDGTYHKDEGRLAEGPTLTSAKAGNFFQVRGFLLLVRSVPMRASVEPSNQLPACNYEPSAQSDNRPEGPNPDGAAFKEAQQLNELAQKHHQNIMIDWKLGYILGSVHSRMAACIVVRFFKHKLEMAVFTHVFVAPPYRWSLSTFSWSHGC